MSRAFGFGCAVVAFGLLAAPAARADDISPDQAAALQRQVHDWLATVLGPTVDLSAFPIEIVPEGDHYRINIPLPTTIAGAVDNITTAGPITATAKPLDGGRWAIDGAVWPSPLDYTIDAGATAMSGAMTSKIADQHMHAVFDPSLATPSSLDGEMQGLSQTFDSHVGGQAAIQTSSVARILFHQAWQPDANGHVTLQGNGEMDGYASSQHLPNGQEVTIAIDKIRGTGRLDGADFDAFGKVIRAALSLAATAHSGQPAGQSSGKTDLTPEQRDMLHDLLTTVGGLTAGMQGDETFDGVHVQAQGQDVSLAHLALGGGLDAPQGRADLHLRIALDGIDSPAIPPGVFRDYMPKHVVLAPRISGIPKADLMAALQHAIDAQGKDPAAAGAGQEMIGLLAKGPLRVGLDTLSIDLGPATLTGSGGVRIASPTQVSGDGELRMTGLDALLQVASTTPELKQAAPVLIFLKGIGKPDGNATLWKISYHDNKLMVNDTDLSGMVPQGK